MIVKDWMREAAEEIEHQIEGVIGSGMIREIIAKHCPMKDDEAWMRAPRCETCKHWLEGASGATRNGICDLMSASFNSSVSLISGRILLATGANFGCVRWEGK